MAVIIPFPQRPDWWATRYEPDWSVVDAGHAEMWPEYARALDGPAPPRLTLVR